MSAEADLLATIFACAETLWSAEHATASERREALELWVHAGIKFNHAPSAYRAADIYREGLQGIPKDPRRASQLYEIAFASGDVAAQASFGQFLLEDEDGIAQDAARGRELLERAAEAGHVDAISVLGYYLVSGKHGFVQDAVRGRELLELAVDADHVEATYALGMILASGMFGIAQNLARSRELLERAADAGLVAAIFNLGCYLVSGMDGFARDVVRGRELLERAADSGLGVAMSTLGHFLVTGTNGFPRDAPRGKELLERAVDAGHITAMYNLGNYLVTGSAGLAKDTMRGRELLERAIDAGHITATYFLGTCLISGGHGIVQDAIRGKQLLERAADAGYVRAKSRLAVVLADGADGISPAPKHAQKLHEHVRLHASWEGHEKTAETLRTGDGSIRRNIPLASKHYQKALELAMMAQDRAYICTEYARLLLESDIGEHRSNTQRAIELLEEAVTIHPYRETLSGLINVYRNTNVTEFRNLQRATELKLMDGLDGYAGTKVDMFRYLVRGGDEERRLLAVLEQAVVQPRSCLLLVLGAPKRGKTATMNSLRGLPFVSQHIPTDLCALSDFVTEPGPVLRGLDDDMLGDLDFRENSFRSLTSRLCTEDVIRCAEAINESNADSVMRHAPRAAVPEKHIDVLEIVRQSLTHAKINSRPDGKFARCWDMGGQNKYEMAHSLFVPRADILIFVVNLEHVRQDSMRKKEVKELCDWMQLGYMLVKDPSKVRVVIVGTHNGQHAGSDSLRLLRRELAEQLGEHVYDEWVREHRDRWSGIFVAIENSRSMEDPEGSGLENLESAIRNCLVHVLEQRKSIPLRWLAVVDKLRRIQREGKVLWSKREVEEECNDFPGFPTDESERSKELLKAFRVMTAMTGISSAVLFELPNDNWILSVNPERLLGMFRAMLNSCSWERFLKKKDIIRFEQSGVLGEENLLQDVWGAEYTDWEKRKMIEVLCECDLLVRLRGKEDRNVDNLYGVPALFASTRSFSKSMGNKETRLEVVTEFRDALPSGLQGGLTAYLCRTVPVELQRVDMVGKDSILFILRGRGRVIVEYRSAGRETVWTCIGRNPLQLAHLCIDRLESFLRNRAHRVRVRRDHVFKFDCDGEGCEEPGGVRVHFHEVWKQVCNDAVYCDRCGASKRVSKLFKGIDGINDTECSLQQVQNSSVLPSDLIVLTKDRMFSATFCFGEQAIEEACKGLSRVLCLDNRDDIDDFRRELEVSSSNTFERNYSGSHREPTPCFAISYVQHKPERGRNKLSAEQWENLRRILNELAANGVKQCRLWLDQCLWLRDASQKCWAQTGVLPYLLWPVISLGDRKFESDRTLPTYERMWPFVEEVAGLWSLGVITASAERGRSMDDGCRKEVSFSRRELLRPEESMRILLLNIYHGATDDLKTGWVEDVKELKEMARWNMELGGDSLTIGSDWKRQAGLRYVQRSRFDLVMGMALQTWSDGTAEYLEGSRRLEGKAWDGFVEWTSGNERASESDKPELENKIVEGLSKISVTTMGGEFRLLGCEGIDNCALWLVVAMEGHSCSFSTGKVKWTQLAFGKYSSLLKRNCSLQVVELVLSEQLGIEREELNIVSVKDCTLQQIEWT